jgi:hypothetical protein
MELDAALREGRVEDLLALVHPQICCQPLVRPGRTTYYGHEGMARLVADMRAVHGYYQIQAHTMALCPRLTGQARVRGR